MITETPQLQNLFLCQIWREASLMNETSEKIKPTTTKKPFGSKLSSVTMKSIWFLIYFCIIRNKLLKGSNFKAKKVELFSVETEHFCAIKMLALFKMNFSQTKELFAPQVWLIYIFQQKSGTFSDQFSFHWSTLW